MRNRFNQIILQFDSADHQSFISLFYIYRRHLNFTFEDNTCIKIKKEEHSTNDKMLDIFESSLSKKFLIAVQEVYCSGKLCNKKFAFRLNDIFLNTEHKHRTRQTPVIH